MNLKYTSLPQDLFVTNRKRFVHEMKPGSIAIFGSNDEAPKNGDGLHSWRQNSDLFWLTGIDQEDTWLILFPDSPNPAFREVLYIRETNDTIATWEGHKYSHEEAAATSGIQQIHWSTAFHSHLRTAINMAENVYLNLNEHDRAVIHVPYHDLRFARQLKQDFPLHQYYRAAPILHRLRSIKQPAELELIKHAIAITKKAYQRVLGFVKPGVGEWEIEAELIHEYIRNRATGHSFQPIIASGASACVLHYVENNRVAHDGDLVLMDTGCEYANYCSDLTRCFPVNGRFTSRQKEVYDAVLRLHREAMNSYLKPGIVLEEYNQQFGKHITEECIRLGLMTQAQANQRENGRPFYKKYCVHGISHHLGLDVHDAGSRWTKLEAGMVLTCEPGIYIQEEGIGIRIETDVVITENGCQDLMADFPIETEEIEAWMHTSVS